MYKYDVICDIICEILTFLLLTFLACVFLSDVGVVDQVDDPKRVLQVILNQIGPWTPENLIEARDLQIKFLSWMILTAQSNPCNTGCYLQIYKEIINTEDFKRLSYLLPDQEKVELPPGLCKKL